MESLERMSLGRAFGGGLADIAPGSFKQVGLIDSTFSEVKIKEYAVRHSFGVTQGVLCPCYTFRPLRSDMTIVENTNHTSENNNGHATAYLETSLIFLYRVGIRTHGGTRFAEAVHRHLAKATERYPAAWEFMGRDT